jgi:hypothetical protein
MKMHRASTTTSRAAQTLPDVRAAATLEDLGKLVKEALCARDRLDPVATPIATTLLLRAGKPCGLLFETRGPRRMTSSAIWSAGEYRILTYDSSGQRTGQIHLSEAPDLGEVKNE